MEAQVLIVCSREELACACAVMALTRGCALNMKDETASMGALHALSIRRISTAAAPKKACTRLNAKALSTKGTRRRGWTTSVASSATTMLTVVL